MTIIIAPGNRAISTLYGWPGSKEIRVLLKALRLGKEHLKDAGSPTDEHIVLPASKMESPRITALQHVTGQEFSRVQTEKTSTKAGSNDLQEFAKLVIERGHVPTNGTASNARLRDQERNRHRRQKAHFHESIEREEGAAA